MGREGLRSGPAASRSIPPRSGVGGRAVPGPNETAPRPGRVPRSRCTAPCGQTDGHCLSARGPCLFFSLFLQPSVPSLLKPPPPASPDLRFPG